MKPLELLDEIRTPEGTALTLLRRGNEYLINADGKSLMASRMHGSEEELATLGCVRAKEMEEPFVLVGGLGMGFTLRATLDVLPEGATVVVAELIPAVVKWNEMYLGSLNGHPLRDPRVKVEVGDVAAIMQAGVSRFDAILLDVDNGPRAFTQQSNSSIYDNDGLAIIRAALKPKGIVAVWSAWDQKKFEHRLRHFGFDAETVMVRARLKAGGPKHTIFLGRT